MREHGYIVIDEDKLNIIEHKLKNNNVPILNKIEAKMFAELLNETNKTLLETDIEYKKEEYDFFKASDSFLKTYKKWEMSKK